MPWPGWRLLTALAFALCNFAGPGQALAQAPLAPSAQAPDQQPKQVLFDFEMFLAQTLAPGLHYYAFQQKMKSPFDLHDTDRDGAITDADRQRNRQRFEAMYRAQQIGVMFQADLNSDGVITADELAIFARYNRISRAEKGPKATSAVPSRCGEWWKGVCAPTRTATARSIGRRLLLTPGNSQRRRRSISTRRTAVC